MKNSIRYMIPCITVVCVVGAYSTSNSMYGVLVMLLSGVIGYTLDKNKYSVAPMLESNMRKAFIASGGSAGIFFASPISLILMLILFAIILTPITKNVIKKLKQEKTVS